MLGRALITALYVAVFLLFGPLPGRIKAQDAPAPAAELVLPTDGQPAFSRLFTPASGPLFALSDPEAAESARLVRSDDGGTTWRSVTLPPAPPPGSDRRRVAAVDPVNHTILYATGADGLYKSDDDAASWRPILPIGEPGAVLAVSPADHQLVYLRLASADSARLLRSSDGGASWETAYTVSGGPNCAAASVLIPHPTDPNRLVANVGCGPDNAYDLFLSRDRGTSWSPLLKPQGSDVGSPIGLVGGRGARPERLYAGFTFHYLREPYLHLDLPLYRSDDDGQTWSTQIIVPFAVSGPKSQARNPATLTALEYDLANPDRVYVGLRILSSPEPVALQTSGDGGRSWNPLGIGGARAVNALALGIDGLNLYAATDRGIYRLRLR